MKDKILIWPTSTKYTNYLAPVVLIFKNLPRPRARYPVEHKHYRALKPLNLQQDLSIIIYSLMTFVYV